MIYVAIDFSIIGKRIKEARKEKYLTQEQLSEKMGVSIAYLSKVETGKLHINLERLSQICNILDVTEGKILNGVSNQSEKYLHSEFYDLLKKCSSKEQKLAYKILQCIIKEKAQHVIMLYLRFLKPLVSCPTCICS